MPSVTPSGDGRTKPPPPSMIRKYFHVWGSIICSVLVVCAHIPLALLSMEHFKGIWRLGPGTISWEAAEHHAPTWLERDVVRTNIEK